MTTFPERLGIHPTDSAAAADAAREATDVPAGDGVGQGLTVSAEHLNVNGGLHGGVLATLLDTTMGGAVREGLKDGESTVTVSMTVTYLAGANEGDELVAGAEIRKRGGSLVLVEGEVTRKGDGEAIAHAVATFTVIGKS